MTKQNKTNFWKRYSEARWVSLMIAVIFFMPYLINGNTEFFYISIAFLAVAIIQFVLHLTLNKKK